MVPSTLVGVIVFVASVGPGYLYVRIIERFRATAERTPLRELAEIVVTGSVATLIGTMSALVVGHATGFLSLRALSVHPGRYLIRHPGDTSLGLLLALSVSYGLAALVAARGPGRGARVYPDSAWYAMFERRAPADHVNVATVELKDGRKLTGIVVAFTAEPTPVDDRELTLGGSVNDRIKFQAPGSSDSADLLDDYIVLRGSEIASVALTYWPADPVKPPTAKRSAQVKQQGTESFGKRWRRRLKGAWREFRS